MSQRPRPPLPQRGASASRALEGPCGARALLDQRVAVNNESSCQEMIEVVTNYLDGALPPDAGQRFEHHLSFCAGCSTYVDQMRETFRHTGVVPREESLPPALRERIIAQFRTWRQG
jgi:anti-sigma factor (TIGR02949 family)